MSCKWNQPSFCLLVRTIKKVSGKNAQSICTPSHCAASILHFGIGADTLQKDLCSQVEAFQLAFVLSTFPAVLGSAKNRVNSNWTAQEIADRYQTHFTPHRQSVNFRVDAKALDSAFRSFKGVISHLFASVGNWVFEKVYSFRPRMYTYMLSSLPQTKMRFRNCLLSPRDIWPSY